MRIHLAMLENYLLEIKGVLEGKLDSEVDACAPNSPNPDLEICLCLSRQCAGTNLDWVLYA